MTSCRTCDGTEELVLLTSSRPCPDCDVFRKKTGVEYRTECAWFFGLGLCDHSEKSLGVLGAKHMNIGGSPDIDWEDEA